MEYVQLSQKSSVATHFEQEVTETKSNQTKTTITTTKNPKIQKLKNWLKQVTAWLAAHKGH